MGETNILYLTLTESVQDTHTIVHYALIGVSNVYVTTQNHRLLCCIVDIDEMDACALVLKGHTLFEVKDIVRNGKANIALMVDHHAVIEWSKSVCYT